MGARTVAIAAPSFTVVPHRRNGSIRLRGGAAQNTARQPDQESRQDHRAVGRAEPDRDPYRHWRSRHRSVRAGTRWRPSPSVRAARNSVPTVPRYFNELDHTVVDRVIIRQHLKDRDRVGQRSRGPIERSGDDHDIRIADTRFDPERISCKGSSGGPTSRRPPGTATPWSGPTGDRLLSPGVTFSNVLVPEAVPAADHPAAGSQKQHWSRKCAARPPIRHATSRTTGARHRSAERQPVPARRATRVDVATGRAQG